jgi:hypothetical protein
MGWNFFFNGSNLLMGNCTMLPSPEQRDAAIQLNRKRFCNVLTLALSHVLSAIKLLLPSLLCVAELSRLILMAINLNVSIRFCSVSCESFAAAAADELFLEFCEIWK